MTTLKFDDGNIAIIYSLRGATNAIIKTFNPTTSTLGIASTFNVAAGRSVIKSFNCQITDDKKKQVSCYFVNYDYLLYEVIGVVDHTQSKLSIESSAQYNIFSDYSVISISSGGDFMITLTESLSKKDRRLMVYKRIEKGGTKDVIYSLQLNDVLQKSDVNEFDFAMAINSQNNLKLIIQTKAGKGLAKLYDVQDLGIKANTVIPYDLENLSKMQLDLTTDSPTPVKLQFTDIFEPKKVEVPATTPSIVVDSGATNEPVGETFLDSLKNYYWLYIILGVLFLLFSMIILIYCIRRERIKEKINMEDYVV